MMNSYKKESELKGVQERLLNQDAFRCAGLKQLEGAMGSGSGQRGLLFSSGDSYMAQRMCDLVEQCAILPLNNAAKASLKSVDLPLKDWAESGTLDFPDGHFDLLVVIDGINEVDDDLAFFKECHRVLRPNGRLIFRSVQCRPNSVFSWAVRKFLFVSPDFVRVGYPRAKIFKLLRDGFDVPADISFGGFFSTWQSLFAHGIANRLCGGLYMRESGDDRDFVRIQRRAYKLFLLGAPFRWLSLLLDKLLPFLPRYQFVMSTKPRGVWRSRDVPKLRDGRSIAHAALNSKIGTAVEF